ncbi:response regulator [Actinomycetota bacterium]
MPPDSPAVLVVEDEEALAESIAYNMEMEGYRVRRAATGTDAMAEFHRAAPDLILLDVMLPGLSGLDVCRRIRSISDVPIIMLTARSSEGDVVAGLELGADDYVTKPFSMRELVSRVRARLRSRAAYQSERDQVLRAGPVALDPERHEVRVDGEEVAFRPKEFELLEVLLRNKGRLMTRESLLDQVWGTPFYGDPKTLNVHVKRVRKKIGDAAKPRRMLLTVRGLGYKFVDD